MKTLLTRVGSVGLGSGVGIWVGVFGMLKVGKSVAMYILACSRDDGAHTAEP